jgi:hypothetical protein
MFDLYVGRRQPSQSYRFVATPPKIFYFLAVSSDKPAGKGGFGLRLLTASVESLIEIELSEREEEVLRELAWGESNMEIANPLQLETNSIKLTTTADLHSGCSLAASNTGDTGKPIFRAIPGPLSLSARRIDVRNRESFPVRTSSGPQPRVAMYRARPDASAAIPSGRFR